MYQLLVILDWILAVDYDFFRIFFYCKSLAKPAGVDSCVTAAIFWNVFNIAGWAFFNVDEFQQAEDEQNEWFLHMVTGTQSEWHGMKVCLWGALVLLGIFKKKIQGSE